MDRFEAMRTLIAAVDGGSLTAASRTLGIPLPTVSRRVSDLEARLGTRLLARSSRALALTEAGSTYVAAARRVLDDLGEAERAASGEYREPRGELLMTAPILFGQRHVAPVLHEFLFAYPAVAVRLVLFDGIIDLVETHLDVALRIGRLPDSALVARRLGEVRWVVVASPAYLARRGVPERPGDVAAHECIAFEWVQGRREWGFVVEGRAWPVTVQPRYSVNTADAVVAAASAGLGLARVMSYQAADAVREGRVQPVLEAFTPPPLPVQLVHAPQPLQPLKQRACLDFMAPRLSRILAEIAAGFATPSR